jgi:hypothetical protein
MKMAMKESLVIGTTLKRKQKHMPKYLVTYRVWSDFQTQIEADSQEDAEEMLINNGVDDADQDFIMSDFDYDNIDIMEVE